MKNVFSSIATGSVVITVSRLMLKVLSFGSYVLVLQRLSLHDYGVVSLALSISGPVLALSGLGLDDLLSSNGARARGEGKAEEFAHTLRGFVYVKFAILVAITIALIFGRTLLGDKYRDLLEQFFIPLIAWIWVVNIRWLADMLLQMRELFTRYAKANVIENSVRLCVVIGLYLTDRIDISTVIWSYVAAKLFASFFTLGIVRGTLGRERHFVRSLKDYWRFIRTKGFWEIIRMQIGSLLSGVGMWIVGFILGLEAVAVYSFVSIMNSLVSQMTPFRQILYPIMARLSPEAAASSFTARRMSKYSFWLAAALIPLSMIVAPIGIGIFVPKYLPAIPVFYLMVWTQLLVAATVSHGPFMYARNEQKYLLGLSFFGTVSSLTLAPLLIWLLGLYGAVLENHISGTIIAYLRERRLRKKHAISTFSFRDLFVFDKTDREFLRRFGEFIRLKLKTKLSRG